MTQHPMFQISRLLSEGTAEPFVARLWANVLELRDLAINARLRGGGPEQHKRQFDELYHPVLTALQECREATKDIISLLDGHRSKLASASIVQFQPNAVTFTENIDRPLHRATSRLLVNGVIAMDRSQDVTKFFGIDIGSVFGKPATFARGMDELRQHGHVDLERYLRDARSVWAETFRAQRVAFEHEGWTLPKVRYRVNSDRTVELDEPAIASMPISRFAPLSCARLLGFVETTIVYAMKTVICTTFGSFATIVEIPADQRESINPKRFRYLPPNSPYPEWTPRYRDDDFPMCDRS